MLTLLTFLLLQPEATQRLQQVADSVSVVRAASRAQVEFETQRRQRLPVGWGAGGRCDVRVGRFCYWHDESLPRGPEEPASIAPLRERLLSQLRAAANEVPGDRWVAGQWVRYLVEAGNHSGAIQAARSCRAEEWWCLALEGFALHAARDYLAAEQLFDAALGAMDSTRRCAWTDVSVLLSPNRGRDLSRWSCAVRDAWAAERWALADPLWSLPGNDRRTEHFSRHVMAELERVSRSPYHLAWGEDSYELMLRYGWPERWSRRPASGMDLGEVHVIGHEPHPAFQFFPDDSGLAAPDRIANTQWNLRPQEAENRYAPLYAGAAIVADAQVARFPRGDAFLVVTAVVPPVDTAFDERSAHWSLGMLDSARVASSVPINASPTLTTVPGSVRWVSIEGVDSLHRAFARHRLALPAPEVPGLLLYRDPRRDDATLEAVVPRMLPGLRVRRAEPLGLYWEYAAPAARDSLTHVISVYPRSARWLTRLARTLRLADAAAPVHVRVEEPATSGTVAARALAIDLSGLAPGTYDLRVRVESGERTLGDVTRTITVVR